MIAVNKDAVGEGLNDPTPFTAHSGKQLAARAIGEITVEAAGQATVRLSEKKSLSLVEEHFPQFGVDQAIATLLQRVTDADANLYIHEASESTFMKTGLS